MMASPTQAKLFGNRTQVDLTTTKPVYFGRKNPNKSANSIFVHLGNDNKTISRKHAKICFNASSMCFEIKVYGKNGVIVGSDLVGQGSRARLENGMLLKMGEIGNDKTQIFLDVRF